MKVPAARTGCDYLKDSLTSLDVWQLIHSNADEWTSVPRNTHFFEIRQMLDQSDTDALHLLQSFSSEKWSNICEAVGWTVYGAVALSWCEGAKLEDVWTGWLTSGFSLKPLPEFERPARFINPALLPQTNKSGEINSWAKENHYTNAETYQLVVSATIAALKEPLVFELEPEQYKGAMPQIASFLKSRMLQEKSRTPEQQTIMDIWSETIKGTHFDVWTA